MFIIRMSEITIKGHKHKNIPKGSVISLIGTRGSGKSLAIKSLCYHFKDIPRFHVVSKTEKNNNFFSDFIPSKYIQYDWDPNLLKKLFKIQDDLIDKYGKTDPRTHMVLILDDCLCDKRIWRQPEVLELVLNGRHKNITFIFSLQYPIGISPELRGNIDFVFIYIQECSSDKKKIYEHFAGTFDNFKSFKDVLDETTEDYYCMVVNRKNKTNKLSEKIFRYKAPLNIPEFKAGSKMFWNLEDCIDKRTIEKRGIIINFE